MNQQPRTRHLGLRGFAVDRSKPDGDRRPARAPSLAVIFIAALLLPATPAVSIAAPDDPPVYSLVTARQIYQRDTHFFGCAYQPFGCQEFAHAIFDEARSLAGPAVEPDLNISSELRGGFHSYAPVLIVVLNRADGLSRVVAHAAANESGRACIAGSELDRLGWHPTGPEIVTKDGGVCADLTRLAALPTPPVPLVTAIASRKQMRKLRRQIKRRR